MKVLLIKDVYNLGRAGEVKKVADGYARNFLLPQKMAVIASAGALKQIEKIQTAAAKQRELLNEEMSGLAEQISGLALSFKAKIGETGKLYGSITQQQIIDGVNEKLKVNLDRHQIETGPLREEGEHSVRIRLTFDLIPEFTVTVENEEEPEEEVAEGRKPRGAKIEEVVETEETVAEDTIEEVAEEAEEEVAEVSDAEEPVEETAAEEEVAEVSDVKEAVTEEPIEETAAEEEDQAQE